MNLILLNDNDFVNEERVILCDERRIRHIRSVHQVVEGQSLRVGRLNGLMGRGRICQTSSDKIEMQVVLNEPAPEPLPLTLLLALPRPKILRRILQTVTTMGVKNIVLFHSYQVDKNFWRSDLISDSAIHEALVLGLEQARDTQLPQVEKRRWFKPFVEDDVPGLSQKKVKLVAHPGGGLVCPSGLQEEAVLAVGPEGGFLDYEVDKFCEQGFERVSLGPRVLKVEAAVVALMARLMNP